MEIPSKHLLVLLKNLKDRAGMYVQPVTYETLVAYISGYDHGVVDSGGKSIQDPFQNWLEKRIGHSCSLNWTALVRDVLAKKDSTKAIQLLFELFQDFFGEENEKRLKKTRGKVKEPAT